MFLQSRGQTKHGSGGWEGKFGIGEVADWSDGG
jgi:hypothetical protein